MHNSRHTKPVRLSERVICSTQRQLLTQHTTNTSDTYPCPQRDSNPRTELSIERLQICALESTASANYCGANSSLTLNQLHNIYTIGVCKTKVNFYDWTKVRQTLEETLMPCFQIKPLAGITQRIFSVRADGYLRYGGSHPR